MEYIWIQSTEKEEVTTLSQVSPIFFPLRIKETLFGFKGWKLSKGEFYVLGRTFILTKDSAISVLSTQRKAVLMLLFCLLGKTRIDIACLVY